MKWSYKTVHFELKKEGILGSGFLDEFEIEQELNDYGRAGWELVSVLEVQDGMIAFFKQPFGPRFTEDPEDSGDPGRGSETQQRQVPVETVMVEKGEPVEENREDRDLNDNGIGAIRIE